MTKVLIIDDDSSIRHLIDIILKKNNYSVQSASSIAQAFALIQQHPPDVIFCDLMLLGETGIDFLRLSREKPEIAGVPVIIISATGEERLLEEARMMGAFACLQKPFSKLQLLTIIEDALESVAT